jgi:hypothetical protein
MSWSRVVRVSSSDRASRSSLITIKVSSAPPLHPAVYEHRVDGGGTPVVDDGRDVDPHNPRGDLVEPDQHQIPPSLHWNVPQDGLSPRRGRRRRRLDAAIRFIAARRRSTRENGRRCGGADMGELTTDSTPGGSPAAAPTAASVAHAPPPRDRMPRGASAQPGLVEGATRGFATGRPRRRP